jgi:hypothetical protein
VISKEEKAKLIKPVSRATSPSGWAPEPKAPGASKNKGKGKGKVNENTGGVQYCYQFAATKACKLPVGECKFQHLRFACQSSRCRSSQGTVEENTELLAAR